MSSKSKRPENDLTNTSAFMTFCVDDEKQKGVVGGVFLSMEAAENSRELLKSYYPEMPAHIAKLEVVL